MEEVELFVGECVYMSGYEVLDPVAYFHFCGYLLIYFEFLVCCIVQKVLINSLLYVFIEFNNSWHQVFITGGYNEVFVSPDIL